MWGWRTAQAAPKQLARCQCKRYRPGPACRYEYARPNNDLTSRETRLAAFGQGLLRDPGVASQSARPGRNRRAHALHMGRRSAPGSGKRADIAVVGGVSTHPKIPARSRRHLLTLVYAASDARPAGQRAALMREASATSANNLIASRRVCGAHRSSSSPRDLLSSSGHRQRHHPRRGKSRSRSAWILDHLAATSRAVDCPRLCARTVRHISFSKMVNEGGCVIGGRGLQRGRCSMRVFIR
jgi:hypothetical protein